MPETTLTSKLKRNKGGEGEAARPMRAGSAGAQAPATPGAAGAGRLRTGGVDAGRAEEGKSCAAEADVAARGGEAVCAGSGAAAGREEAGGGRGGDAFTFPTYLDADEDERPVMVKVDHVSMEFNMASEKLGSFKEYFIALVKGKLYFEKFTALDDINLEVRKGDVYGILGTNGSGKSTLLKIIAGVLEPSRGHVDVHGNIAPLIELGAGFDVELSARENIYLNGALLGYSKEFIDQHFDAIVEFAEIEKFLDMPMKNYSSGMVARIAFAIATVIVPEILIVDEALSVGDFMFQQKCEDRISDLISKHGVTVLFVSHSNDQIERLCNKAVWIEKGHTRLLGTATQVCNAYRLLGGRTGSADAEAQVYDALLDLEEAREEVEAAKDIIGEDYFTCATELAWDGWHEDGAQAVILVPDYTHTFAVGVSALAGAIDAPVLPYNKDNLPTSIIHAVRELNAKCVYVAGTTDDLDQILGNARLVASCNDIERIDCGGDFDQNQLALVEYLARAGCIKGDAAIAVAASQPAIALAVSHAAGACGMPVLSLQDDSPIADATTRALKAAGIKRVMFVGKPISSAAKAALDRAFEVEEFLCDAERPTFTDISKYCVRQNWVRDGRICIATGVHAHWQSIIALPAYAARCGANIALIDESDLERTADILNYVKGKGAQNISFVGNRGVSPICKRLITFKATEPLASKETL